MREEIDVILKNPIGEAELALLSANVNLLTDKEKKELGLIAPEPMPGPEVPFDPELEAMPKRSEEEVEAQIKTRTKKKS